jgi:hypothetical protein
VTQKGVEITSYSCQNMLQIIKKTKKRKREAKNQREKKKGGEFQQVNVTSFNNCPVINNAGNSTIQLVMNGMGQLLSVWGK